MTQLKTKKYIKILVFFSIFLFSLFLVKKNIADLREIFLTAENKIKQDESIIKNISSEKNNNSNIKEIVDINEKKEVEEISPPIKKINHLMPFISQAPKGKWDKIHEEACEEASLLLAHYFIKGRELVLSEEAESDLQKLLNFTQNVYPKKEDINIQELNEVAKRYFNYENFKILLDPKEIDLENILKNKSIIIMPASGRTLKNPYFKNPGPLYHMLVISGFDSERKVFITQDPGTKRGKNYEYPYEIIIDSIHDFDSNKEEILKGKKVILIVSEK